jgi:hypothetical protein
LVLGTVPFVSLHCGFDAIFRKVFPFKPVGCRSRETTMTRIVVFALNVMLFGLSAALMVKAPAADGGQRRRPEPLEAGDDAGAVLNLV